MGDGSLGVVVGEELFVAALKWIDDVIVADEVNVKSFEL